MLWHLLWPVLCPANHCPGASSGWGRVLGFGSGQNRSAGTFRSMGRAFGPRQMRICGSIPLFLAPWGDKEQPCDVFYAVCWSVRSRIELINTCVPFLTSLLSSGCIPGSLSKQTTNPCLRRCFWGTSLRHLLNISPSPRCSLHVPAH